MSQPAAIADALTREVVPVKNMKKIGAASFVGTLIEFYDFQIYSAAAALVFAHVFFPELGKAAGAVAAFGTIGVAFVARPLGSILFGHFGDRLGRKKTLVTSLVMMGVSTVCVGLLPTGEQIGIAAPILLVLLRVIQGLAAGGEFAGAALFLSENAPAKRRALWACIPSLGGAIALSFASVTVAATSYFMGDESYRADGWRIPFLLSAVLLIVGLYIRLKTAESPVFLKAASQRRDSAAPVVDAFRNQWREMLKACLTEVPAFTLSYLVVTYFVSYGANELHFGYTHVLAVTVVCGLLMFTSILASAYLSDRIGRKPVLLTAIGAAVVWALVVFPVLHMATLLSYAVSVSVSVVISGFIFGPVGGFMSELFPTRYRYTAVGLCYNGAGIFGGALPPLVATPIIARYGTLGFSCVLAAIFVASFICCSRLRETRGRDLQLD